jgi:hypothetical protein
VRVPFWDEQIQFGDTAYAAMRRFEVDRAEVDGPTWCFDRFGATRTRLPDGRVISIAGEHEDGYDPDFKIYNDVVEFRPDGSWQVYLYPREVFPPTDFHAAVFVDPFVYVFGSIGYGPDRLPPGRVPRLHTATFEFETVETSGDVPPRLLRCFATRSPTGNEVTLFGGCWYEGRSQTINSEAYRLDLKTLRWSRVPVPPSRLERSLGDQVGLPRYRNLLRCYDAADIVRRVVPFGHRLWGAELRPVYGDTSVALCDLEGDAGGAYALVDLPWGEQRARCSDIQHVVFDGRQSLIDYLANPDSYARGELLIRHSR